ncbi:MAG TPA: hypothetical protein VHF07_08265, partial [Nitrospiraceae bacterium]|nr:hypothetical protein [Nitrospiraceae bacterium]
MRRGFASESAASQDVPAAALPVDARRCLPPLSSAMIQDVPESRIGSNAPLPAEEALFNRLAELGIK